MKHLHYTGPDLDELKTQVNEIVEAYFSWGGEDIEIIHGVSPENAVLLLRGMDRVTPDILISTEEII